MKTIKVPLRMFSSRSDASGANTAVNPTVRAPNPYTTKWFVLFDAHNNCWIPFVPREGMSIYPCFACNDLFSNRESFLDHVNRRGLILNYWCTYCHMSIKFFNTCAFLLHAREHFPPRGGTIDLDQVHISTIPMDHAGFLPHLNYPRLYDAPGDQIWRDDDDDQSLTFPEDVSSPSFNVALSVKFYKPRDECSGKRFVNFVPNDAVFVHGVTGTYRRLVLRRLGGGRLPRCKFVDAIEMSQQTSPVSVTVADMAEPPIETVIVAPPSPVISAPPTPPQVVTVYRPPPTQPAQCPECGDTPETGAGMREHFLGANRPLDDSEQCPKCQLISPTQCSLDAHLRTHDRSPPHVCPECGKGFDEWQELHTHMDDVCFHLAKTVRYRCPARRCGKIFAQLGTFIAHLPMAHMLPSDQIEGAVKSTGKEENGATAKKDLVCTLCKQVCPEEVISAKTGPSAHVLSHVRDKQNRMYVYVCRHCRGYYRSKQTYATHLLRCAKLMLSNRTQRTEARLVESHREMRCKVLRYCPPPCHHKVMFHCTYGDIERAAAKCPKCGAIYTDSVAEEGGSPLQKPPLTKEQVLRYTAKREGFGDDDFSYFCLLCSSALASSNAEHMCKYMRGPVIRLRRCDGNVVSRSSPMARRATPTSSVEEQMPIAGAVMRKKKRRGGKRSEPVVQPIRPVSPPGLPGEYRCRYCDLRTMERSLFQQHVLTHRDLSTAHQCMECGECFVVRPSLAKHLQALHGVEDVAAYMQDNECYDVEAVRILEENVRTSRGRDDDTTTVELQENECRICRRVFPDNQELNKHFRVHGMAFLRDVVRG